MSSGILFLYVQYYFTIVLLLKNRFCNYLRITGVPTQPFGNGILMS